FCQSLLRGFPLEAGLAPQFAVVEDRDAAVMLAESREAVLATPGALRGPLENLAGLTPPSAFGELVAALNSDRALLQEALERSGGAAGLAARVARRLGLAPGEDEAGLLARAAAAAPDLGLVAEAKCRSRNASD